MLDSTQSAAFRAFKEGKSVAIIGAAGCGKSYLLNCIIEEANKSKGGYPHVMSCAPSNHVAKNLGGKTIHTLFGAHPHWTITKAGLKEQVQKDPLRALQFRKLQVLVIDEIGFVTTDIFDAIDAVLRQFPPRELDSFLPFGGRQLVVAGDPFQLEPVPQHGCNTEGNSRAFFSRSWYRVFEGLGTGHGAFLTGTYRHGEDAEFHRILERLRYSCPDISDIHVLNATSKGMNHPPASYTLLYPLKRQVRGMNDTHLGRIQTPAYEYHAEDKYYTLRTSELATRVAQTAEMTLRVKIGCKVLTTVKIRRWNPGSVGTVRGLTTSVTGALSVLTLEMESDTIGKELVRVHSFVFKVRGPNAEVLAERRQFPLIPGYAVTTHKCQGLTLPRVAVNFEQIGTWRPHGMVYVALSRAKRIQDIWVKGLCANQVTTSPNARRLMEKVLDLRDHCPLRFIARESYFNQSAVSMVCPKRCFPIHSSERTADRSSKRIRQN